VGHTGGVKEIKRNKKVIKKGHPRKRPIRIPKFTRGKKWKRKKMTREAGGGNTNAKANPEKLPFAEKRRGVNRRQPDRLHREAFKKRMNTLDPKKKSILPKNQTKWECLSGNGKLHENTNRPREG